MDSQLENEKHPAPKDMSPKMLEAAAESLTLRRDVIRVIDAQPPADEKLP
jgi:hypothetical protein